MITKKGFQLLTEEESIKQLKEIEKIKKNQPKHEWLIKDGLVCLIIPKEHYYVLEDSEIDWEISEKVINTSFIYEIIINKHKFNIVLEPTTPNYDKILYAIANTTRKEGCKKFNSKNAEIHICKTRIQGQELIVEGFKVTISSITGIIWVANQLIPQIMMRGDDNGNC